MAPSIINCVALLIFVFSAYCLFCDCLADNRRVVAVEIVHFLFVLLGWLFVLLC